MQSTKPKRKMVDRIESFPTIDKVFNVEWVKELQEKNIFTGEPKDWKITEENIADVLRAISVNTTHYKRLIIEKIRNSSSKSISYKEMTVFFKMELLAAAQQEIKSIDDSDLFRTPAQKIIQMLREIQNNFLASEIDTSH